MIGFCIPCVPACTSAFEGPHRSGRYLAAKLPSSILFNSSISIPHFIFSFFHRDPRGPLIFLSCVLIPAIVFEHVGFSDLTLRHFILLVLRQELPARSYSSSLFFLFINELSLAISGSTTQ